MMLPSAVGFAELVQETKQSDPSAVGSTPYLEWSQHRQVSRVPGGAAVSIFFNDLPLEKARQAALRLGPQADGSRVLIPEWTQERFGKLPRLYIEARLDRSVTLPLQRTMQSLTPGADVVSLNAGHAPQVSRPDEVAEALSGFIEKQLG